MIKFQTQMLQIHENDFKIMSIKLMLKAYNYCLLYHTANWPNLDVHFLSTYPSLKFHTAKCDT